MTEPAKPKGQTGPGGEELVEIEAMDLEEWERDKHTPRAGGEQMSELVKQSAAAPPPVPARHTQTIARSSLRPPTNNEKGLDGPTVRNAGAALPATRDEDQPRSPNVGRTTTVISTNELRPPAKPPVKTPAAGTPTVGRTTTVISTNELRPPAQTPPGGSPLARIETKKSATPAGGVPIVRGQTPAGGTPTSRTTPAGGSPTSRATPVGGTPVSRNTTARTPAAGVPLRSSDRPPASPPPRQTPAAGVPMATNDRPTAKTAALDPNTGKPLTPTAKTLARTPAQGVSTKPTGRTPAQGVVSTTPTAKTPAQGVKPTTTKTPALGVKPTTTKTPAQGVKPPTPMDLDPDTEGWSLPDDDLAIPVEAKRVVDVPPTPKVVAPKPKLEALQAETWSLPDSIVEDPPARGPADGSVSIAALADQVSDEAVTGVADEPAKAPFDERVTNVGAEPKPLFDEPIVPEPVIAAPTKSPLSDAETAIIDPIVVPVIVPATAPAVAATAPVTTPTLVAPTPPVAKPSAPVDRPSAKLDAQPLPPPPVVAAPLPPPPTTDAPKRPDAPAPALFDGAEATSARAERNVKTDSFPVVRPAGSKKPLVIGAIAAVLALVAFLVLRGGDDKPASPDTIAKRDPAPEPRRNDPPTGSDTAAAPVDLPTDPATVPATPPVDPSPPVDDPTPPTTNDPASTPTTNRTRGRTPRGKIAKTKTTPTETAAPTAPPVDSLAIARAAYDAGNKRLYAGDAAGAIAQFKDALEAVPGFAAAHRGIGLAYSLQGDKARAVGSFKTYLAASPGAKDTKKIQERIAALQAK